MEGFEEQAGHTLLRGTGGRQGCVSARCFHQLSHLFLTEHQQELCYLHSQHDKTYLGKISDLLKVSKWASGRTRCKSRALKGRLLSSLLWLPARGPLWLSHSKGRRPRSRLLRAPGARALLQTPVRPWREDLAPYSVKSAVKLGQGSDEMNKQPDATE